MDMKKLNRVLEQARKFEKSMGKMIEQLEDRKDKKSNVKIPGLGAMTEGELGDYNSKPIYVPVLGGKKRCITVTNYGDDSDKAAFHIAIANFLALPKSALKEAERHIFQFYKDYEEDWKSYDDDFEPIKTPAGVWKHVRFGDVRVSRRAYGDKGIYVSVGGGCDWEPEHGLEIVFKNGLKVNKVGPCDGHLTNSDAWGKKSYENVIYKG